jgi:hypothetical protein
MAATSTIETFGGHAVSILRIAVVALLFCASLLVQPNAARAAQSYDNCKGFITSLPTTISTQGVWCLKGDLSTAITNGAAIYIAANNVTIDCNDFKIGGLAAGDASQAYGVEAYNRQNATIRHCGIRGFLMGTFLIGGAGHLVEDNRFDNNLWIGIWVDAANSRVRRNAVYDTGGAAGKDSTDGIHAFGSIVDNEVSGLFAAIGGGSLTGIRTYSGRVEGNAISGFNLTAGDGQATPGVVGIDTPNPATTAANNRIVGPKANAGYGIKAGYATDFCMGNTVTGFYYGIVACSASGNLSAGNAVN